MLHSIVRWLARRAIRWFYRDAEILSAEAIPREGATLIVASHGNDLTDILMTFLLSRRDILFVANMSAADSPVVRWVYAGLGVIPVSRVRDARALKARGADASVINANAFLRVVDALKAGHAVAIFPEGNVNDAPHLGLLRNGAAKMALQAVERGIDLTMVPVGYQYESPTTPRSGLLAVVGNATRVKDWRPVHDTKAITEFTKFMRHELQQLTRNSRSHRDAEVLSNIAAVSGAVMSSNFVSPIAAAHKAQLALSHHSATDAMFVANAVAPSAIDRQQLLEDFADKADALANACVELGAHAWSARDCADILHAAGDTTVSYKPANIAFFIASAPLAAVAWLWHAVPVLSAHKLAVRYAPLRVEIAARTVVPGMYIIWLWYLVMPALLHTVGVNRWIVLTLFIAQPRLGDFAFWWRDELRKWRMVRRVTQSTPDHLEYLRACARIVRERCNQLLSAA